MAKYTKTIDILSIPEGERSKLPIGQWVTAGDTKGPKGRFFGSGRTDVVAWMGNARGRYRSYMTFMHGYGQEVMRRAAQ